MNVSDQTITDTPNKQMIDYSPLSDKFPRVVKSELTDIPKFNNLAGAIIVTVLIVLLTKSFIPIYLSPIIFYFVYSYISKSGNTAVRISNFAVKNGFRFKSTDKKGEDIARLNVKGVLGSSEDEMPVSNQVIGHYKDFDFRLFSPFTKGDFWVMRIQLKNMYPHIILDSRSNNKLLSRVGRFFGEESRLSLEGDFDNYFKAYSKAPAVDSLRILSPDVMVMAIDSGTKFDIEIIEDNLHIIGNFQHTSESNIRVIFDLADLLLSKLDRRTATVKADFDHESRVE